MIRPLTLTAALRSTTQQSCPTGCGAERLILKQWLTLDEYRAHQAGETVEYHVSLACRCGYDERALATADQVKQAPQEGRDAEWEAQKKGGTKL